MFLGTDEYSVDAKGRVPLPAKHRPHLGKPAFVTEEVDGCLAIWPHDAFERRAREMSALLHGPSATGRGRARAFFAGATEAVPDAQGRISLPAALRNFAAITRNAVIVGVLDHLELWEPGRWRQHAAAGEQSLAGGAPPPDE